MDGLHPKGYAGTADHPGGCPGQNILEIKNSGRRPHLVGKGEEKEEEDGKCFLHMTTETIRNLFTLVDCGGPCHPTPTVAMILPE